MADPSDNPDPHETADAYDTRDWDIARDGRMRDHADDPEPITVPWEG